MLKRNVCIVLLLVLILANMTACTLYEIYQEEREIQKLPDAIFDENGDIVYNGSVYKEMNIYDTPFKYKSTGKQILKTETWLGIAPVCGWGEEDFGVPVIMVIMSTTLGPFKYLKSDFEFPDYLTTECSGIFVNDDYASDYGVDIFANIEKSPLFLKDILLTVDNVEVNDIYREYTYYSYINVHFTDYQTIFFCADLYIYNDKAYVVIVEKHIEETYEHVSSVYKFNDEYQELFINAIKQNSYKNSKDGTVTYN